MMEICARWAGPLLVLLILAGPVAVSAGETLTVAVEGVAFVPSDPVRVNLAVSVIDASGRAVQNLSPGRFQIHENGEPLTGHPTVRPFVATDRSLAIVTLMDHREDTAASLTLTRRSLVEFHESLGFGYSSAVVSYSGTPRIVAGPSGDVHRLNRKIWGLEPVSAPPRLIDGVMFGLDVLRGMHSGDALGQNILVVLTEGADQEGRFSFEAAAERLKGERVKLFVVGYGDDAAQTYKALAQLAGETGGHAFFAGTPDELPLQLQAVSERIRFEYVLSYDTPIIRNEGETYELKVVVESGAGRGVGVTHVLGPGREQRAITVLVAAGGGLVLLMLLLAAGVRRKNSV